MAKYSNYKANLAVLRQAPEQDLENEFVQSGIVDKFAMQFELAWKLLQKALSYEGRLDAAVGSPRGIIKAAYSAYDFIDEDAWLSMLADRNAAEHVYDAGLAERLVGQIIGGYIAEFEKLISSLEAEYGEELLETF
ncbi:HI0074 family nucleotidyltransferase substrate-binding subunit [Adlercreutzia murintestinalis]|jgi:nucleotidyltransferase substrate binding protein, HI0074 family|uniref:HI0074 family nucleotidyltransferase substrate-binding subunit n=1 Tax=Adlercreutzia murintestinalis TaxID=2941325 RepID=UPI00203A7E87|nr:HI0074 family nucleotidyltransferase substrate-binding subunit [Adlercreutzia murintestinalis]